MSGRLGRTVWIVSKTSATGSLSAAVAARRGFTLFEILLVLLLIMGILSVFVVNMDVAFRQEDEISVEDAFWDAAREARLQALYTRRPVSLLFNEEEYAFELRQTGGPVGSFPIGLGRNGVPLRVQFVQERPSSEYVLLRGEIQDTRPIAEAVFYPDGTCTTFWVELRSAQERWHIRIDPWSGAELLKVKE